MRVDSRNTCDPAATSSMTRVLTILASASINSSAIRLTNNFSSTGLELEECRYCTSLVSRKMIDTQRSLNSLASTPRAIKSSSISSDIAFQSGSYSRSAWSLELQLQRTWPSISFLQEDVKSSRLLLCTISLDWRVITSPSSASTPSVTSSWPIILRRSPITCSTGLEEDLIPALGLSQHPSKYGFLKILHQ